VRRPERAALQLLDQLLISKPPVPVERIATTLGVRVMYERLDETVSGMLFRSEDGQQVIGVNTRHAPVRQRFTIAHELGHQQLHRGRAVIVDHLARGRVNFRDVHSSLATDREEIDANAFGAALLMPPSWVAEQLEEALATGLRSSRVVDQLAATFNVSRQAMENRLVNLGLRATP
jgi:Zn-dependent peptidase ImmA (M78 family)